MVATPINLIPKTSETLALETDETSSITTEQTLSLEDYLLHPPEHIEWVNGQLVEKTGMTAQHGYKQD